MTARPIDGAELLGAAACELERACAAALGLVRRAPRKSAPRRKPRSKP
ncbi:hypothetical protein [Sphingomonas hengshuiensis]|nr:hypothetical protein [Sphingomonas hengshuiensis]